jgi:hypothetical protein
MLDPGDRTRFNAMLAAFLSRHPEREGEWLTHTEAGQIAVTPAGIRAFLWDMHEQLTGLLDSLDEAVWEHDQRMES